MKRLLNTLYVSTQGAYLKKEGQAVVVEIEKQTKLRVPIHNLASIVCFGNVLCSPFLLGHCAENKVNVSFLTEYGRFLASVQGTSQGNVLLRREQYRWADDDQRTLAMIKSIVAGKLLNARYVLMRSIRDHTGDRTSLEAAASRLRQYIQKIPTATDPNYLRGIEGEAAKTYFGVFNEMLTRQKQAFSFTTRSRRPPLDKINALLSFIYTLLMHDISSALQAVGLDPFVGFLHRDRPGRKGLALDLMEEFRPCFADRFVVTLINLQQIQAKDFEQSETGSVRMTEKGRKKVLEAYQKRKQDIITHDYLGEKMQVGLLFHVQAHLLARHLRGDEDAYPPLFWK